jgi:hypothetical protein
VRFGRRPVRVISRRTAASGAEGAADASGEPLIIVGLPPGLHKVEISLANANNQPLDRANVSFTIPEAGSRPH